MSGLQAFESDGLQGFIADGFQARARGPAADGVVWLSDNDVDKVYELDPSDLSAIRSSAAPSGGTDGTGGSVDTLYHCDWNEDKVYELDTSDFSIIRSSGSPEESPDGAGGTNDKLWHCNGGWAEDDVARWYELDTADFSVVQKSDASNERVDGMGGSGDTVFSLDSDATAYELDPSNLSVLRSTGLSDDSTKEGIGGDSNRAWAADFADAKLHELDVSDFSIISTASSPGTGPSGLGGSS